MIEDMGTNATGIRFFTKPGTAKVIGIITKEFADRFSVTQADGFIAKIAQSQLQGVLYIHGVDLNVIKQIAYELHLELLENEVIEPQ